MKTAWDLHRKWLEEEDYREAYLEMEPEFAIARTLLAARAKSGLTQAEVARKMHTTQSAVARLESGRSNPSVGLLKRYASAIGSRIRIELIA